MYTILINNDNHPITTKKDRIIQFNNMPGELRFLVYPMYEKELMKDYSVYLEFITPNTKTLYRENLILSEDTYREYLQYDLTPDTSLTSEFGRVMLRVLFTTDKQLDDGSIVRYIRRTRSTPVDIYQPDNFGLSDDLIPDSDVNLLNQRLSQIENQITELSIGKADNLYLFDGGLTLQSNNVNIGNVIDKTSLANAVIDGATEGLIKVVEFWCGGEYHLKRAAKICHGNYDDIDKAIKNGVINENDIIVTKDTKELIFINENGEKEEIKGRVNCYNSTDEALANIKRLGDITIGQFVMVLSNNKYTPYIIQKLNGEFVMEQVIDTEPNIEPLSNRDIEDILRNL